MPVGYWCPVLHAHLPYVRHPEYPEFLEEDWFYEGIVKPLADLQALEPRLRRARSPRTQFKLTRRVEAACAAIERFNSLPDENTQRDV